MGSCEVTVTGATSLSLSQHDTKMLCVVLMHTVFFIGVTSSMFADDYDPNDVPADQARGYSYPVPETPLSLPLPVLEEYDDYDDYDPSDVPQDQAAPSAYLPPTNDEYDDYDPSDIPADQAARIPSSNSSVQSEEGADIS